GTVVDGGDMGVLSGGTAIATTINRGGLEALLSGAVGTGTIINGGGELFVQSGGIVLGAITFTGTSGMLMIGGTSIPTNVISGFGPGDTIDLAGVGFDSAGTAQVTAGNVLHIVENGHAFDIHLDPTANFSGAKWHLAPDGVVGTDVSIDDAAPTL